MEKIYKIWKDPVWSKVIAAFLLALFAFIYHKYKDAISCESVKSIINNFLDIKINLWVFILFSFFIGLFFWSIKRWKNAKNIEFKYDEETLELDRILFKDITTKYFPQNPTISFLRTNNFAGFSFNPDNTDNIYEFEIKCKDPNFIFFNPELEHIKNSILNSVSIFTTLISFETFPTEKGYQTVPPEWELEQPERFDEIVNKIHTTTREICKDYDSFVRKGKGLLKI